MALELEAAALQAAAVVMASEYAKLTIQPSSDVRAKHVVALAREILTQWEKAKGENRPPMDVRVMGGGNR